MKRWPSLNHNQRSSKANCRGLRASVLVIARIVVAMCARTTRWREVLDADRGGQTSDARRCARW